MHDLTDRDIDHYILGRFQEALENQSLNTLNEIQASILQNELRYKANGVFLWVKLAVDSLCRGIDNLDTYELLHERLKELPEEIDDIYTHMLSKIDKVYRGRAARLIRLVLAQQEVNQTYSLNELSILTLALTDFEDSPYPISSGESSRLTLEQKCARMQQTINMQFTGFLERREQRSEFCLIEASKFADNPKSKYGSIYMYDSG